MHKARVTTDGRLPLPRQLRQRFGIKPGTKVCLIERGTEIILQPITKAYIRSVCGMLKSKTNVARELLRDRRRDNQ